MTKNVSRLARFGLVAVALTILITACGTKETGNPAPDADSADTSSPTDASSSPDVEGTGPEQPRPPDKGTSVSFPDLPAGRDDYDDSQVRQCMTVKWLGRTDIPAGVSVQVKTVRITPPGVFDLNGTRCGGVRGCTDSFAFTSAGESCSVSIKATAKNGMDAYLRLAGRCVSRNVQQCDELLADDGSPIPLSQPQPDEDPPSEEQPPTPEESPPPTTS
jgi:hypothetical protein